MVDVQGEAGRRWPAHLPELMGACARRWQLTVGDPFPLSSGRVVPADRADGVPCVLKMAVPNDAAMRREATVLRVVGGEGAVRLLDQDLTAGALLLERAEPGASLAGLVPGRDDAATVAAARVLRRLWRPCPAGSGLPPVAGLAEDVERHRRQHGRAGPLAPALVDHAATLLADLTVGSDEPVLLHGDLHHDNVRSSTREPWLAIDPKGLVGDPTYDTAALLVNPFPVLGGLEEIDRLLQRRVERLADELRLAAERIVAWGFVRAVLAEVWHLEDHGRAHGVALRVAERLRPRLT